MDTPLAYGYVRTSTDLQAYSAEAQRATVEALCRARGWSSDVRLELGASGRTVDNRSVLKGLLDLLDAGRGVALVVAKLDRLTRSPADAEMLMARSLRGNWQLVSADFSADPATAVGRFALGIMCVASRYEVELLGERTAAGLVVARAAGKTLGRPRHYDLATVRMVAALKSAGGTLRGIAGELNRRGNPTPAGGQSWHPTTVRRLLEWLAAEISLGHDPLQTGDTDRYVCVTGNDSGVSWGTEGSTAG